MHPRRQPVPVWVDDPEDGAFLLEAGVGARSVPNDDPYIRYTSLMMAPTSLVIVETTPEDKHGVRQGETGPSRAQFPSYLENCIIETHAPYFKRQFRKNKLGRVRYPEDLIKEVSHKKGRPKNGCGGCKRAKKQYRQVYWTRPPKGRRGQCRNYQPHNAKVGCSKHVRTVWTTVPDPNAGKMIGTFSFQKLLGLSPGTKIIFEISGRWVRGYIQEYPWWLDKVQAAARASIWKREQAEADKADKAKTRTFRMARQQLKRHRTKPTRYDMLANDD